MVPAYHPSHVGLGVVDRAAGDPAPERGGTKKKAPPAHTEQPGGLQGCARTAVPLSVAEMRGLFWRLVLATQQRVERSLGWSTWRRWHQGIARYWHYKRRAAS